MQVTSYPPRSLVIVAYSGKLSATAILFSARVTCIRYDTRGYSLQAILINSTGFFAMASTLTASSNRPFGEWNVKELTEYLRQRVVSTTGYNKEKLVKLASAVAAIDLPVDPDLAQFDTARTLAGKLERAGCSFSNPAQLSGYTDNFDDINK